MYCESAPDKLKALLDLINAAEDQLAAALAPAYALGYIERCMPRACSQQLSPTPCVKQFRRVASNVWQRSTVHCT
ncbi:hypothetical protein EMIT0P265_180008 [Pseudomonas zeae]